MHFDRSLDASPSGAVARRCACVALAAALGFADDDGIAAQETIEEIVVTAKTGSRIGRQGDSPSPLSNYDGKGLRDAGLKDLRDLVGVLAINAGAENNSDNLTQNFTVGTANINLRGLGVASTLVLLNGRRQVLSAVQTDDGSSFVDLAALVPAMAIERVEILKDGATAIYGSEAVAGVANFITRLDFEGIEVQAEYRSRTGNGSQDDITLDGVVGGKIAGDGEFLLAASYLDRTSLVLIEVDWLRPATSGFGNPGSFNVPSLGRTVADAECERYDGLLQQLANGGTLCRFDYGPQVTAIPNERRTQALWSPRLVRGATPRNGVGRVRLRAQRHQPRRVAELPGAEHAHRVPAVSPGQPPWRGRAASRAVPTATASRRRSTTTSTKRRAWPSVLEGRCLGQTACRGTHRGGGGPSTRRSSIPRDVVAANFQGALCWASAASDCNPGPGAAAGTGRAGATACSSIRGVRRSRPPARAIALVQRAGVAPSSSSATTSATGESRLTTLEAQPHRDSCPATGGAFAVGACNIATKALDFAYDHDHAPGRLRVPHRQRQLRRQGRCLRGVRRSLGAPVDAIGATGALRYENYGEGVGDTLDPKLTVLYRATDALSLRGSFSTSFRAPSPFQTRGVQTNFTNIVDHDGSRTFAGRRTLGDPQLQPETSRAYNAGIQLANGELGAERGSLAVFLRGRAAQGERPGDRQREPVRSPGWNAPPPARSPSSTSPSSTPTGSKPPASTCPRARTSPPQAGSSRPGPKRPGSSPTT